MPITHEKPGRGGGAIALDEPAVTPTPFNAYQYGALPTGPATPGPMEGGTGHYPPSEHYPNPWGSAPPTTEGGDRLASPPAPTSDGSIYSGTALGSGNNTNTTVQRPLQVRNPTPGAPLAALSDVKDRTVFLSAERGLQVQGGQPTASGSASAATSTSPPGTPVPPSTAEVAQGVSSGTSGSSSAPFVHQDAGAVPGQSQPRRRTKAAEASADASGQVDAPPAYEE